MNASLHIGIIPDGNRRWAKKQGLFVWKGHEKATENLRSIIDWCHANPDVGVLTLWIFSTENWKRDNKEVEQLMKMFEKYLIQERQSFQDRKIRFTHSGRKDRLPDSLGKLVMDIEEETKHFTDFILQIALDYGGKDELLRAINKLKSAEATDESVRANLDQPSVPDLDLIIRTSGEQRTSNFFLWQSSYAEWIFSDKLFPDFGTEDLEKALSEYQNRQRRFGK